MATESPTTFLFTDIEGSTRLWEREPERMRPALARHDQLTRAVVEAHGGEVVKMTGDGVHAAFPDPLPALLATIELQVALLRAEQESGVALRVRCGLHAGEAERRDDDFHGPAVHRAARVMGAAHGGQVLLSEVVARRLAGRLPPEVTLRDLGRVRLRDLASAERVFQVEHPRLRARFPALRALEDAPNNLPHALDAFIGREREAAEAAALLGEARLATLVGMGGVGKTRLAVHVASRMLDAFPDGAWFVELASLHDPRLVPQALATVLGVVEEAGGGVEDAVIRHLGGRTTLVVLDNCEHLLEACGRLAHRLLTGCERVKVLATSREPLGIAGERVYPVTGLPVPGPRAAVDPEAALQFPAVQLFIDRAKGARRDFDASAAQAPAIAAICHRLDGIPLAIELAAARTRALSVQQIAIRLDDRFRLLASRDPATPPKQRTLRALIDWSYELLDPFEASVFRELSVFAGGWTLEAAEAVCAPLCPDGETVLDALGRLADKSLVTFDPDTERYHMLETVREYAQLELHAQGGLDAARRRHLDCFAELARQAKPHLTGAARAEWLARLDAELDNLLAAHAAAGTLEGGAQPGLQLACDLKFYWLARGLLELGERLTREALAPDALPPAQRCRGLFNAGQLSYLMGRAAEARSRLGEALALARGMDDQRAIAAILQPLGMAALALGERAAARGYLEEAVAQARVSADRRGLAAALTSLSQAMRIEADADGAREACAESLAIARELGDAESEAIGLANLAMLALESADLAGAREALREAVDFTRSVESERLAQCLLDGCAGLAALAGDGRRAARLFAAAERIARRTRMRRDPADQALLAPLAERHAGEPAGEEDGAALLGACAQWLRAP